MFITAYIRKFRMGVWLLIVFALAFISSACEPYSSCESDVSPKVGKYSDVYLFVKSHIYVVGDNSGYTPDGYYDFLGMRFRNANQIRRFRRYHEEGIKRANEIFAENGAEIYLIDWGTEIEVDTGMIEVKLDQWGVASRHAARVIQDTRDNDPGFVHIHWSWVRDSAVIGVGEDFSVIFAPLRDSISGVDLAHELVHSFGYEKHLFEDKDAGNLMHDDQPGTQLNAEQISIIWETINNQDDLIYASCKEPLPVIPPPEIVVWAPFSIADNAILQNTFDTAMGEMFLDVNIVLDPKPDSEFLNLLHIYIAAGEGPDMVVFPHGFEDSLSPLLQDLSEYFDWVAEKTYTLPIAGDFYGGIPDNACKAPLAAEILEYISNLTP